VFPDKALSDSAKRGSSAALIEMDRKESDFGPVVSALMITSLDPGVETIRALIDSCRVTHEAFRFAAEAAANGALKQLFVLYAQQRRRFAAELSGLAHCDLERIHADEASDDSLRFADETELLRSCLAREKGALDLYRKALLDRKLPTKAHFLVSAQLALLERAHSRIAAMETTKTFQEPRYE
jgi:hypothetical protein